MTKIPRIITSTALLISSAIALSACGAPTTSAPSSESATTTSNPSVSPKITEASALSPRLALTYDGGVMTVDGRTMKLINTVEKEGFLRLSSAGDNRHLAVADGKSYQMMDLGTWEQPHGDHSHMYTTEPTLTQLNFAADHTGHVISEQGKTAMFADGTGTFEVYRPAQLTAENKLTATHLDTEKVTLAKPHHGFAIPLKDNKYMVAVGDEDTRTGAAVVDEQGHVLQENKQCPGVHGEAQAAHDVITIGCEDGALIYKDGKFTKITNPEDSYSRSGNQAGSEKSDVVLADYKTDKDAELERPEQFSLINTTTEKRQKVQLPKGVSYSFRSLARGPEGEALLLTTDGKLRYFDQDTGAELGPLDLMKPWTESETWQDPRPALWVDGNTAYVTDPSTQRVMAVSLADLHNGNAEKFAELKLPHAPNEINGVSGKAVKNNS